MATLGQNPYALGGPLAGVGRFGKGTTPLTPPPPATTAPPPAPPPAPINLFDQPQQFPGKNFGSNDFARSGTYLSNWLFNALGGIPLPSNDPRPLPPVAPLPDQAAAAQTQGLMSQLTGGLAPSVLAMHQRTLGGELDPAISRMLDEQLANQLTPAISTINAATATAERQYRDQLPRALAHEAVMGTGDEAVRSIAELETGLRGQRMGNEMNLYGQQLGAALQAGDPQQIQQRLLQQQQLGLQNQAQQFGYQQNQQQIDLARFGQEMQRRAMQGAGAWQFPRDINQQDLQYRLAELASKAAGGK